MRDKIRGLVDDSKKKLDEREREFEGQIRSDLESFKKKTMDEI